MSSGPETFAPPNAVATTQQIGMEQLLAADQAFQDNVDSSEVRMSRLSICQGTTKEIAGQVAGYELGQIISTRSRKVLSTKGSPPWLLKNLPTGAAPPAPVNYLAVCIAMRLPNEYLEIIPKDEQQPGEMFFRQKSLNKNDPWVLDGIYQRQGGRWGTKDEHKDAKGKLKPPPITEVMNYLTMPVSLNLQEPAKSQMIESFAIASFQKTSHPTGLKLSNDIQTYRHQKIFFWDSVYYLWTSPKPTDRGITQIYNCVFGGLIRDLCPEMHSMVVQMATSLSGPDGKRMQEYMLSATEITNDQEEHEDPNSGSDPGTFESSPAGAGTEADEAFGDGSGQKF